MRINGFYIGKVLEPKSDNIKVSSAKSTDSTTKSDEVTISNRAVEVSRVQQFALSLPDVREDKVSKFKNMVQNNEYKVSDDELASSILNSINQEK